MPTHRSIDAYIIVPPRAERTRLLGVRPVERLVRELSACGVERVFLLGEGCREAALPELPAVELHRMPDAPRRLPERAGLVLDAAVFADAPAIGGLLEAFELDGGRSAVCAEGNAAPCILPAHRVRAALGGARSAEALRAELALVLREQAEAAHLEEAATDDGLVAALSSAPELRRAERALADRARSDEDGPVARHLNRCLSTRLSRWLASAGVSPNLLSGLVALLGVATFAALAAGGPMWLAAGGILFHLSSVLDGCDGEVARLSYRTSARGRWLDAVLPWFTTALFTAGLGLALWRTQGELYAWIALAIVAGMVLGAGLVLIFRRAEAPDFRLGSALDARSCGVECPLRRALLRAAGMVTRRDVYALLLGLLVAIGFGEMAMWLLAAGTGVALLALPAVLPFNAEPT